MTMINNRLAAIAAALSERAIDADPYLIFVSPQFWPSADQAAFQGDDPIAQADAIERNSGERPGARTKVIAFYETTRGSRKELR